MNKIVEKDTVEKHFCSFDDSCYEDAKQYHLVSFSTRNSTLNTSLRKPIRMQDFIQFCDSNSNDENDSDCSDDLSEDPVSRVCITSQKESWVFI